MPIGHGNQEALEQVLSSPKAQTLVASGTTALAIDHNIMQWMPQYITLIGGSLGIILTIMMIIHKYIQIKNDLNAG